MRKTVWLFCGLLIALLAGCSDQSRTLRVTVDPGGCFYIGKISSLVVKTGDEQSSVAAEGALSLIPGVL